MKNIAVVTLLLCLVVLSTGQQAVAQSTSLTESRKWANLLKVDDRDDATHVAKRVFDRPPTAAEWKQSLGLGEYETRGVSYPKPSSGGPTANSLSGGAGGHSQPSAGGTHSLSASAGVQAVAHSQIDKPRPQKPKWAQDSAADAMPVATEVVSVPVTFDLNSAQIDPTWQSSLNDLSKVLKDSPAVTLMIEGHTDSSGNEDYNRDLSQRRAVAVQSYLAAQGVPPAALRVRGRGAVSPLDGKAPSDPANRRVEFLRVK